jgi:serine/threonine protein kinase
LRLGKYEVVRRLAKGGMAEIFLARVCGLPGFQRMVVLKRILPLLASKADFLEMFLNEARIAATLQHPNVVQMYDVGVSDGHYFITMEYLHGEDVRRLQSECSHQARRIPVEHALHIILDVCAGLHYAHEKIGFDGHPLNIVHRDVSPQNVIVTFDGAVKLLDFGVAKASSNLHETLGGVVKGKVPYMSPEQCRGRPLDRRSDLFSVGIMLYELTLGRRLFSGKSELETLKRIAEQPVRPPHTIDPDYDERLERIVMRALAKNPDRRYQTARDLQSDLEELARQRGMFMSAIALQKFMASVFGPRIEAWRETPPEETQEASIEIVIEQPAPLVPRPDRSDRTWRRWAVAGAAAALVAGAVPSIRHQPSPVFRSVHYVVPSRDPVVERLPARVTIPPIEPPVENRPRRPRIDRVDREVRREARPELAVASNEGELVLAAQPWCEVSVDGVLRGPTPITLRLAPGAHTVRLTNASFGIDSTATVRLARREVLRRAFRFP